MSEPMNERIRIQEVTVLSDDWYLLRRTTFDFRRNDGTWQTLRRETYDRGNGAVILLYCRSRRTVLLTRQFRFPAYVNGHDGMLIEACAGLLDEEDPATCIRREIEEETGYRVAGVRKVFQLYMSPGSVTEVLHFFVGEYAESDRVGGGGGVASETEDIEVLELTWEDALRQVASGEIVDAKTVLLLQHAELAGLFQ